MISGKDLKALRLIAKAGNDYDKIKRLLRRTCWEIDEDDVELGFLRVFVPVSAEVRYRLIIGYRDPDHPPYSLLTFALFPDSEKHVAAFDSAFRSAAENLTRHLGTPTTTGDHRRSLRTWSYAYHRWSLPEGEFTLVQDEFDIQEGMDVTLWTQPVGTPIEKTLRR